MSSRIIHATERDFGNKARNKKRVKKSQLETISSRPCWSEHAWCPWTRRRRRVMWVFLDGWVRCSSFLSASPPAGPGSPKTPPISQGPTLALLTVARGRHSPKGLGLAWKGTKTREVVRLPFLRCVEGTHHAAPTPRSAKCNARGQGPQAPRPPHKRVPTFIYSPRGPWTAASYHE